MLLSVPLPKISEDHLAKHQGGHVALKEVCGVSAPADLMRWACQHGAGRCVSRAAAKGGKGKTCKLLLRPLPALPALPCQTSGR